MNSPSSCKPRCFCAVGQPLAAVGARRSSEPLSRAQGGSRANPGEAEAIGDWLCRRRQELEEYYHKVLEKLVAILTPYRAQKGALRKSFEAHGISGSIISGTVHVLKLEGLGQKYPDIEVALREMGTAAQRTALRQGEIDVAFIIALRDREFAHHQLTPVQLTMMWQRSPQSPIVQKLLECVS